MSGAASEVGLLQPGSGGAANRSSGGAECRPVIKKWDQPVKRWIPRGAPGAGGVMDAVRTVISELLRVAGEPSRR